MWTIEGEGERFTPVAWGLEYSQRLPLGVS